MWPVITALARSYAPQIVFPAALVMGFIGEVFFAFLESCVQPRKVQKKRVQNQECIHKLCSSSLVLEFVTTLADT